VILPNRYRLVVPKKECLLKKYQNPNDFEIEQNVCQKCKYHFLGTTPGCIIDFSLASHIGDYFGKVKFDGVTFFGAS